MPTPSTLGEQKANVKYLFGNFPPLCTVSFPWLLLHPLRMDTNRPRSAGVTAAAAYAILCCVSALLLWGYLMLTLLNAPRDDQGHTFYEVFPRTFFLVALVPPALIAGALRTAVGVLQLRPWARLLSMIWAAGCVSFCLAIIAFLPFETFVIPRQFVSQTVSTKQMVAVSLVVMLLPVSVWWLFYFRRRNVKQQFLESDLPEATAVTSSSEKT